MSRRFHWSVLRWWEWVLLYTLVAYQLAPTKWLAWLGVPTGWPWPMTIYSVLMLALLAKIGVKSHRSLRALRSQRGSDKAT